jgi:hypothetical protein
VPLADQTARLATLRQRLDAVRPRRSWAERQIDWHACEVAARAAAVLPGAEWQEWRATARAAWDAGPPQPLIEDAYR